MSSACTVPRAAVAAGRSPAAKRGRASLTWVPLQIAGQLTSPCSAAFRPQRAAVITAAKRGGSGGGGGAQRKQQKKSQRSEAEQFEQLMIDWDDAFAADCADTETAAQLAGLAEEGYRKHGRGFVFVQSRLERRSRKAASSGAGGGKGFGAAAQKQQSEPAGAPLPNNPQLVLHEWSAVYIPGPLLGSVGGVFSAAGEGASLSLLPGTTGLLAQEASGSGGGSGTGSTGSSAAAAAETADLEAAAAADAEALDDLRRVLRGQDLSQLYGYIGLPVPGTEGSSSSGSSSTPEQQQQGSEEQQQVGVRAYEPEAGELVVLLAARIAGKPATGAELLVAVRQPDGSTQLELPDGWEALLAGA